MKVLIVEDQQRLGQFLERGLKECAYTAKWVGTCKDALDALAETPFDVVILDLGLPDGDGIEMLRRWGASGFNEPVLILSARDSWRTASRPGRPARRLPSKPFSSTNCSRESIMVRRQSLRESRWSWSISMPSPSGTPGRG